MSEARTEILARVRAALGPVRQPLGEAPPQPSSPQLAELSGAAGVETFVTRLAEAGVVVSRCEPTQIAATVAAICERHGAKNLAAPAGLPQSWLPKTVKFTADDGLSAQALDELDGAISGAALGIAESATIALNGGPRQGRRILTLVPDLYICVISTTQLVPTLPDAIGLLSSLIGPGGQPVVLMTGPSATSDIEMIRVPGVHGPRRIEAIVVNGELPA